MATTNRLLDAAARICDPRRDATDLGARLLSALSPERQRARLDGEWTCVGCGRPVLEGELFCLNDPFCGEPAPLFDTREEYEGER